MKKILVIEDDKAVRRGISDNLTNEHFEVLACGDGKEGYEMARKNAVDLIILDIMLPSMNGNEVCKQLRQDGVQTPILMLTSKKEEVDKVLGLELGADDYVTKPFGTRELVARIKALLRRQAETRKELSELTFGDVYVDFKKQEATKRKKNLKLSSKEFELLQFIAGREGEVVSRADLLEEVWGYEVTPTTRTVDNFILSLRKKIETNPSKPKYLLTVHTAGYKFRR